MGMGFLLSETHFCALLNVFVFLIKKHYSKTLNGFLQVQRNGCKSSHDLGLHLPERCLVITAQLWGTSPTSESCCQCLKEELRLSDQCHPSLKRPIKIFRVPTASVTARSSSGFLMLTRSVWYLLQYTCAPMKYFGSLTMTYRSPPCLLPEKCIHSLFASNAFCRLYIKIYINVMGLKVL